MAETLGRYRVHRGDESEWEGEDSQFPGNHATERSNWKKAPGGFLREKVNGAGQWADLVRPKGWAGARGSCHFLLFVEGWEGEDVVFRIGEI